MQKKRIEQMGKKLDNNKAIPWITASKSSDQKIIIGTKP